jgi:hypothetical protein
MEKQKRKDIHIEKERKKGKAKRKTWEKAR